MDDAGARHCACDVCFPILCWLGGINYNDAKSNLPSHTSLPDGLRRSTDSNAIPCAARDQSPLEPLKKRKREPYHDNDHNHDRNQNRDFDRNFELVNSCAMPYTPPPDSLRRSISPLKRQRTEDDAHALHADADAELEATPRAIRGARPSLYSAYTESPPPLAARNTSVFRDLATREDRQRTQQSVHATNGPRSTSSASRSSTTSSVNSRSRRQSPAKRTNDLLTLTKKVIFAPLPAKVKDAKDLIPEDAHRLFNDLMAIEARAYIPAGVREAIAERDPFYRRDSIMPTTDDEEQDERQQEVAREFEELDRLCVFATEYAAEGASESEWTAGVFRPMLERARRFTPAVRVHTVDRAQIAPFFAPPVRAGHFAEGPNTIIQSKMIDLALSLQPTWPGTLDSLIRRAVESQPATARTVSQTLYGPLCFRPAAVGIEVKLLGGDVEHGLVQLGVWTAAWHRRMQTFDPPGQDDEEEEAAERQRKPQKQRQERRIITLPVLLVIGHTWNVYFACDRGSSIDIVGPMSKAIGDTQSITGAYKLLESLRAISMWIEGDFQKWIDDFFNDWALKKDTTKDTGWPYISR